MRILITGGAGFIGSHVADAYLAEGHDVAVVDDFSSGKQENLHPSIHAFRGSITDVEFFAEVIREFQPDVVNHHAAQISVTHAVAEPIDDAARNILGTINVLNAIIAFAPKSKLIYASSGGAMYGVHEEMPYIEESTPWALSPYGLSKYVAEQYVWLYSRLHGLKATVLRYSNVFGPRQDPHGEAGVSAIFADRMHNNAPVTIYGDGSATRDYVFVSDVARANVAALEHGDGHAYNISTGEETSTLEVFTEMKKQMAYNGEPIFAPLRVGEVVKVVLSHAKAKNSLGWRPEVSFSEGVRITAEWYQNGSQYEALSGGKA